ncbi:hypothetical protein [Runella sp.]|uniref:hypothetical protein n=1 Tax=Runella sp. TaxID=1960881 RepID=UPI003D14F189
MKAKLETLDDLRAERARLKNQLELSRVKMHNNITAIKTEINPARQAVGAISDLLTTPRKGLLNVGVGIGVDLILRRGLLARAGWLPRLVVPFIARNIATNFIQKNKASLLENALIWVKKKTEKPVKVQVEQKLLPAAMTPPVEGQKPKRVNHRIDHSKLSVN